MDSLKILPGPTQKIAACEAVKLGLSKMTAQQSSQLAIFLKFEFLRFLSSIMSVSPHRNGAQGRAALQVH